MLIGKDASKRFLASNFDFLDISLPLALKEHFKGAKWKPWLTFAQELPLTRPSQSNESE